MIDEDWMTHCGEMVHRFDRDRLMCATVAPPARRGSLLALLAFNLEIATIPELVSEPMLGEIRLQWWRDTIARIYAGEGVDHPVALGLAAAIAKTRLSQALFDEYLDARAFDLHGDAPASMAALEKYGDGTAGALNELMAEALGVAGMPPKPQATARAAVRDAGTAWALSGLLAAIPFHKRLGRSYLPADVDPGRQVAAVAEAAQGYIVKARSWRQMAPKFLLPALLPVVLADFRLKQLARCGYDAHDARLQRPTTGRLLRFYWNVLRRTY